MSFQRRIPVRLPRFCEASSCRRHYRAASWRCYALLALLAFVFAPAVPAQEADLSGFKDSLQHVTDLDELRAMVKQRSGYAADTSAFKLTELGLTELRLWDLTTDRPHYRLATRAFQAAIKRDPQYGWAHYGLGLAYVNGPDANPDKAGWRGAFVLDDVVANLTGNDIRSRAHREFLKAISGKPPVWRAADELADNAVAKNKRKTLEDARSALTLHVRAAPHEGEGWVALARVHAELGSVFDAAAALDHAIALGTSDTEIAHARASLLLRIAGREAEGAKLWFTGLNSLTLARSEEYYGDIEALLSKDEREAWKHFTLPKRIDYLRDFWDFRAGLSGVTTTERMAEHYRRLALARKAYFRGPKFGAPGGNELRMLPFSQRSMFDDRGLIYIRHGEPRTRIGGSRIDNTKFVQGGSHMLGYETWVYAGLDGRSRSYHFEGAADDFHLMRMLTCDGEWLETRVQYDARLAPLLGRCAFSDLAPISATVRADAFEALAADSDLPAFTKDLPFYFDLYTFRGNEGRTSVVAAVAVPLEKLNRLDTSDSRQYRLDVSLIVADTASKRVIREDDSLSLAANRDFARDELLRLHVEVAAPPSKSTVQRVIVSDPTEPGVGQLYGGPFPIPDYTGTRLMLSDVVLAEPTAEGRWHRGDVNLALVPTGYFRGGSFNVFYEIYNLAANSRYSTEIEIEPIRTKAGEKLKELIGGKSKMTLRFEGIATNVRDGLMQELRRVDAPLPPAQYRMRITVKNLETQEVARNERTFVIPKD